MEELLLNLFRNSFSKQEELRKNPYWKKQIPQYCPPVLWFGDHNPKNLIVCLASSPSIREFFDSSDDAWRGQYLPPKERRFYHLTEVDLKNIREENVIQRVSQSYDEYFMNKPFTQWFGNKNNGYNIEAFLNGMNASFYNKKSYNAVLIDLIPFVTIDDFSKLERNQLIKDLFANMWVKNHLNKLITYLDPKLIIAFGKNTVNYCNNEADIRIKLDNEYIPSGGRKANYGLSEVKSGEVNVPLIGLSTMLGNPIGFTKNDLNNYGRGLFNLVKHEVPFLPDRSLR